MRKVGLESYMQWLEWCRDAPHLYTACPEEMYKEEGWLSWPPWPPWRPPR